MMWTLERDESRIKNHEVPRARGVTLVEMIVVIAITGILAAVVAVFIRRPVEGYIDAARRAELSDIADTALRRITRDLRSALPNSIRITAAGGVTYLEYLQTSGGGRYRSDVDSGGGGDPLNFTAADATFNVIGPMPTMAAGDSIVIYNLNWDPAIDTANAYVGDNRRSSCRASTATTITLSRGLAVSIRVARQAFPGRAVSGDLCLRPGRRDRAPHRRLRHPGGAAQQRRRCAAVDRAQQRTACDHDHRLQLLLCRGERRHPADGCRVLVSGNLASR